jgi:hypothetical protein
MKLITRIGRLNDDRRRKGPTLLLTIFISGALLLGPSISEANLTKKTPASSFLLAGVTNVKQISQLTGAKSPNATEKYKIVGTDLGSMFRAHGKTWFVFGDTFGERAANLTGGGGTIWRSNTLAYSSDTNPSDGIKLDGFIVDDVGWAMELLSSAKVDNLEMTVIPTYGFEANGAMYLAYMSVKHWGVPGEWEVNHSGLAKSKDKGRSWTKLAGPRWTGTSNFVQVSVTKIGSYLYFWGVTHGRFSGVQLMRVPEKKVESLKEYEYFSGTTTDLQPKWSKKQSAAETIVEDTVGELSVVWNGYLKRWLMTYTNGGGSGTTIRESVSPWGPWGDGLSLISGEKTPGQYAPFMLPEYTAKNGMTIFFTLSLWDPYNVFWYSADLVKKTS